MTDLDDLSMLVERAKARRAARPAPTPKEEPILSTSPVAPIARREPPPPPVIGTVERANDRGVLLAGESRWRNWSRYAAEPRYAAETGERVRLTLDRQGYIRSVTNTADAEPEARPAPASASRASAVAVPTTPGPSAPRRDDDRNSVLLVLLQCASNVYGEDSDADPAQVAERIVSTFRLLLAEYEAQTRPAGATTTKEERYRELFPEDSEALKDLPF